VSSLVDLFVRRIVSALVSLKHAPLQLTRPPRCFALLGSVLDITRSDTDLIVPHQNRTKAYAVCDGWSGRLPAEDAARLGATHLLTGKRSRHIVGVDLAIEDLRAREHRGSKGRLGSRKEVSEAPAPGASLIARRSQVPRPASWAGASWPRYKTGDPRPFEPRISFPPITGFQPDPPAIAMFRSDSGCRAHNHLIPGSNPGSDTAPNRSTPGSRPSRIERFPHR